MPYFENMASLFEKPSEVSVENALLKDKQLSQSHRTHVLSNTLKSSIRVWSGLIKVIIIIVVQDCDRRQKSARRLQKTPSVMACFFSEEKWTAGF